MKWTGLILSISNIGLWCLYNALWINFYLGCLGLVICFWLFAFKQK